MLALIHTCVRVRDVDDLDALLAKLAQKGIEPEKPRYAPGGREAVGRIPERC